MSLSHLSLEQLEQAVELLREKEALQSQVEKIDHQLRELENGKFLVAEIKEKHERLPGPLKIEWGVRRRKNVQQAVLKALTKAGPKGLTVKDLAFRAKVKTGSLRTWLYTTGKKIAGLKKVAPGTFAYVSD